ncbi:coil containing protein [Vibrio phage 1.226.O._10N.261.48.E5]|nr:coil containing protein [Vibrio phage 1.226.O._10N.261.48.E5]
MRLWIRAYFAAQILMRTGSLMIYANTQDASVNIADGRHAMIHASPLVEANK